MRTIYKHKLKELNMTNIATPSGKVANPALLSNAQTYAAAGARVLPLKHCTKIPAINDWTHKATTDQVTISKWFSTGGSNLGIAMGEWQHTATTGTYLVCIDLDRHEPEHDGVALWQQLVDTHGTMGTPFIADTATGGMHLVYQSKTPLTNERGQLPRGIDVRGVGGQIMVEPSVHPDNGKSPKWRIGAKWGTELPGLIPSWLVDIVLAKPEPLTSAPQPAREPHLRVVGDSLRPGDIYNNANTWQQTLATFGWSCVESKGTNSFWARPGKPATKDTHSAKLSHDAGAHGVFTVFSTNAPQELLQSKFLTATGGHYKFASPFDFVAAMKYGGDHKLAAQHIGAQQLDKLMQPRPQQPATHTGKPLDIVQTQAHSDQATQDNDQPVPGHSYVLQPLSELIGVPYEPRVPTRLMMSTGRGLFYDNADNLIASSSGTLKSWLSVLTGLQQIQQGKHVVVIDYEMNMRDWFTRFVALGATNTELALVHYCAPDEPLRYLSMGTEQPMVALSVMRDQIARVADMPGGLAWVIIDGVTNAMTQSNLKLLDNTEIAKFWELLPKQIVKTTGAGVGLNDHVPKNATGDAVLPIGGQHKVATTSGAAHTLRATSLLSRQPLNVGVVIFKCIKDRHGEIGQGREIAQAVFTPQANGKMSAVVEPYTGEHADRQSTKDTKLLETLAEITARGDRGTLNKIANMSAMDKRDLKEQLKNLQAQGKVQNYGTGTNHDWQKVPQDNVLPLSSELPGMG